MKKYNFVVLFLIVFLLASCTAKPKNKKDNAVISSFFPIQSITQELLGESVDVLVPAGQDAHDFELTAKQKADSLNADLFLYHGAGLEFWLDEDLKNSSNSMRVTEGIIFLGSLDDSQHRHINEDYDPHTWLDPYNVEIMVENIYEILINTYPDKVSTIKSNYTNVIDRLSAIQLKYESLNHIENKMFFVDHRAYSYLAKRYGLKQYAIIEGVSEGDATAKEIENSIKNIKQSGVNVIFSDPSHRNDIIDVIVRNTGVSVLDLYTLESQIDSMSFLDGLEKNIDSLLSGLN